MVHGSKAVEGHDGGAMRRVDGCRSGGVGGGAYRIILAAAVLLAALPVAQPQVAKTGRVWTAEAMDPGFHPKHLAQFVKVMNDRNIFASTAVPTNIISVATTTDAQVGTRYFYTFDVDQAGVKSVIQIEAYTDARGPCFILPLPAKNMKSTSPETFTSPTDVWYNVDVASPLIAEASRKADELLQSSVFSASPSGRPELVEVVHAESRRRDLALELQFLKELQENNAADAPATDATLASKRAGLVSSLAAKATALQEFGVDHPTVVSLTCDITQIQAEVAQLEQKAALLAGSAGRVGQARLTTDSAIMLGVQQQTQQNMALTGTVVADSHSYVFMVLAYQATVNFVVSDMRKQVVAYKDELGGWKLVNAIDFKL